MVGAVSADRPGPGVLLSSEERTPTSHHPVTRPPDGANSLGGGAPLAVLP